MNPSNIVSQMLGLATQSNANIGQQQALMQSEIEGLRQQSEQAAVDGATYVSTVGEAARQKAEVEATQNLYLEQVQQQAGMNPDDLQNQIVQSLARINDAQAAKGAELQRYQQLQSVDFMQNPIGYVLAQLQLPSVVAKHNAAVDSEQMGFANITDRTNLLKQVKSSVAANTATAIKEQNLTAAKAAELEATMKVRAEQRGLASTIAQRSLQVAQLDDKKFDNMRSVLNTQIQAMNTQAAMQQTAELRAARAAEANARVAAKETQAQALAELDSGMATIGQMIGKPGITVELLNKVKAPTAVREKWVNAGATLTLGSDIGEAVDFIRTQGDLPALQRTNPTLFNAASGAYASIQARTNKLITDATRKGAKLKPEDARKQAAEEYQAEVFNSVNTKGAARPANDPTWEQQFNPLRVPYAVVVSEAKAGKIPELRNNAVVEAAAALIAANGGGELKPSDDALIFKTLVERVKTGSIGPAAAAAQYAQFYNIGAEKAVEMHGVTLMGVPRPAHYYMDLPVPVPSFLGGNPFTAAFLPPSASVVNKVVPVDARNQTAVEAAITKAVTAGSNRSNPIGAMAQ